MVDGSGFVGLSGAGSFRQTGGTHTLLGSLTVGGFGNATSTYDLQNGVLTVATTEILGSQTIGHFTQSGGSHSVDQLRMGVGWTTTGSYDLQAGELSTSYVTVGYEGTGSFTQSGGTHSVSNTLTLGAVSGATGVYGLQGGVLSASTIRARANTWAFNFTGGILHAETVRFDLVNDGGVLAPGQSVGTTTITGSYTQNAGTLEIELGQDAADSLAVTGLATLGGTLELVSLGPRPREGQTFAVVTADGGFVDDFSEVLSDIVNGIPEGLEAFSTAINGTAYEVVFNGYTAGDANGDHKASIGDLCILAGNWNQAVTGGYGDADFNGDGIVSIGDLSMLAGNWGWELPGTSAVPEPATLLLLALGGLAVVRRRR